MKHRFAHSALGLLASLLALPAMAEPSTPINIHGQLLSSSGTPVSGARAYTVTFFDAATAGNAIGTARNGSVDVSTDGLFNLSVQPPSGIFSTGEVWYSLGVDTDDPADSDATDDIFPSRIRVYYVPFAIQASRALYVDATGVGMGSVDDTELNMLDGATGNVQTQIDAIDTAAIAQHATDIAENTTDIATNAANIATNTADIADSSTAIATNTSDIADNATAIATNTTNIATNASAIALKANSDDVYTTTAADAKFVELAGDTMSGTLGVNTITEATASSGVNVEGVKLNDNYVELTNTSWPIDTSGKLFKIGSDLFWGGSKVSVGGDTDTIRFTAGYLYGADSTLLRHTMTKSGHIVSFEVYGNFVEDAGATIELLLNESQAIVGGTVFIEGDTVVTPNLILPFFSPGDIFEFNIAFNESELRNISIALVVEY